METENSSVDQIVGSVVNVRSRDHFLLGDAGLLWPANTAPKATFCSEVDSQVSARQSVLFVPALGFSWEEGKALCKLSSIKAHSFHFPGFHIEQEAAWALWRDILRSTRYELELNTTHAQRYGATYMSNMCVQLNDLQDAHAI